MHRIATVIVWQCCSLLWCQPRGDSYSQTPEAGPMHSRPWHSIPHLVWAHINNFPYSIFQRAKT